MKQLFEQVFIHSEADLPKETANYFTHNKQLDTKEDRWYADHLSKYWLDNVDWYLLPIDLSKECHCGGYPDCICEISRKPVYDKAYLDGCITKATPRLSKIKDVDKELDEIKGREPKQTTDIIRETLTSFAKYWNNKSGCEIITYSDISRYKKQLKSK